MIAEDLSLPVSLCCREMTTQFYRHPQISEDVTFSGVVDAMYEQDHRRALIEHPRVRFDGVYIAVCHCKFTSLPAHLMAEYSLLQMCAFYYS